jgi:hypothetical protein
VSGVALEKGAWMADLIGDKPIAKGIAACFPCFP